MPDSSRPQQLPHCTTLAALVLPAGRAAPAGKRFCCTLNVLAGIYMLAVSMRVPFPTGAANLYEEVLAANPRDPLVRPYPTRALLAVASLRPHPLPTWTLAARN